MTPISGKLSDIYGKKKVLLIIMIIYAAGVSAGGFTTNIYSMLLVRLVQGIGMSMFPIAFGIIRDQFPRSKIAIGQGIITSMFAAGAVIGLVAGGHLIQNFGWQSTFFSIIPIVLALLVIIKKFIHIDEAQNPNLGSKEKFRNKIDIPGAIALTISVTSFLLTLTFVENGTYSLFLITGLFGIAIISLILFVIIERKVKSPLVDFKVLLHKSIFPANIMVMIVGLSMFMVFQTIPVLVRSPVPLGFGEDPLTTTNVQLPFALVYLYLAQHKVLIFIN
jgi:MFS family permease